MRLLFPADRWSELAPALETEQSTVPEVKIEVQEPQVGHGALKITNHLCLFCLGMTFLQVNM